LGATPDAPKFPSAQATPAQAVPQNLHQRVADDLVMRQAGDLALRRAQLYLVLFHQPALHRLPMPVQLPDIAVRDVGFGSRVPRLERLGPELALLQLEHETQRRGDAGEHQDQDPLEVGHAAALS